MILISGGLKGNTRGLYSNPGCQDILSNANANSDFLKYRACMFSHWKTTNQIQSNTGDH